MSRDQNTFAKRLREMEKKRKQDDKRAKRQLRKDQPNLPEQLTQDIETDDEVVGDGGPD